MSKRRLTFDVPIPRIWDSSVTFAPDRLPTRIKACFAETLRRQQSKPDLDLILQFPIAGNAGTPSANGGASGVTKFVSDRKQTTRNPVDDSQKINFMIIMSLIPSRLTKPNREKNMRTTIKIRFAVCTICFVLLLLTSPVEASRGILPNPILNFLGQAPFSMGGKNYIRYSFAVQNADAYPTELFMPSPDLPPCGTNTRSSRTWVDLFDQRGQRLSGFCGLAKPEDLNGVWFSLEEGVIPPSWVYIEMNDRRTNTKYRSNLADTTM